MRFTFAIVILILIESVRAAETSATATTAARKRKAGNVSGVSNSDGGCGGGGGDRDGSSSNNNSGGNGRGNRGGKSEAMMSQVEDNMCSDDDDEEEEDEEIDTGFDSLLLNDLEYIGDLDVDRCLVEKEELIKSIQNTYKEGDVKMTAKDDDDDDDAVPEYLSAQAGVGGSNVNMPSESEPTMSEIGGGNIHRVKELLSNDRDDVLRPRVHDYSHAKELESTMGSIDPLMMDLLKRHHMFYSEVLHRYKPSESYTYEDGRPKNVFPTPLSTPVILESDKNASKENLLIALANYCPERLRSMLEAVPGGKVHKKTGGKDLHCAEAMRTELDMLCAESFELLRSGMGTELWMNKVLLMEINPISFPYRGSLLDVYDEVNKFAVEEEYNKVIRDCINRAAKDERVKILLISTTVKERVIKVLGGTNAFENFLKKHPKLFINISENKMKVLTMVHPEIFYSKSGLCIDLTQLRDRCEDLSEVMSQVLQHLLDDASIVSDLGHQVFNELEGSPARKALLIARKELYERNRERFRKGEASLQKWALRMCRLMGISGKDVTIHSALRLCMARLGSLSWEAGGNALQVSAFEELSQNLKEDKGKYGQFNQEIIDEMSADEKWQLTQHYKAFRNNWPRIKAIAFKTNHDGSLVKVSDYWQEVDGNEDSVFLLPKDKDNKSLYKYMYDTLCNLKDENDWRLAVVGVRQLNLHRYRDARDTKEQNDAANINNQYRGMQLSVGTYREFE